MTKLDYKWSSDYFKLLELINSGVKVYGTWVEKFEYKSGLISAIPKKEQSYRYRKDFYENCDSSGLRYIEPEYNTRDNEKPFINNVWICRGCLGSEPCVINIGETDGLNAPICCALGFKNSKWEPLDSENGQLQF